jgi:hypothetical protein
MSRPTRLDNVVSVRFAGPEMERLRDAAGDQPLSQFIRSAALGTARKGECVPMPYRACPTTGSAIASSAGLTGSVIGMINAPSANSLVWLTPVDLG